ncbi:MAG TPA: hypothetical protein VHD85_17500 [Terracidiphilus sp.]|nr:hypothetical protein [Terracidiphilus sp.]
MSWNKKNTDEMQDPVSDTVLDDALKNFRHSVHAWSDAAYSRPRTEMRIVARSGWRLAAVWALVSVLAVGSLSAGLYEHHHRQVLAQIRAEQEAHQRQLAAQERARQADEELLATVDSDISRTVPAAMEPLAQMMDEGQGQ